MVNPDTFSPIVRGISVILIGLGLVAAGRSSYTYSFSAWVSNAGFIDWLLYLTGLLEIVVGYFIVFAYIMLFT